MSDIVVVGGGFAGVWAAAAASRLLTENGAGGAEHTVTLVAPGNDLVIRPRLYETDPHTMRVPLDRILAPAGVRRAAAAVTEVDTGRCTLTVVDRDGRPDELAYDRLVLATGSRLVRPAVTGAEHLHDVDTLRSATSLDTHLRTLPDHPPTEPGRYTAVVVGAGLTGLEVATELTGRLRTIAAPHGAADEVRVVLVERADLVGPGLGTGAGAVITRALHDLGVETRLGVTVTGLDARSVTLSDGSRLPARTAVWTAGTEAGPAARLIPGRHDHMGRLEVDELLQVIDVPKVWAAGDAATAPTGDGHRTVQSCQHAIQLGKLAGHNAAADLVGEPPEPFTPSPYVTCLDLGDAGALYTTGWERAVQLTGEEAKKYKRTVTGQWIYPPLDNATELLRQADPRFRTRRSSPVA